MSEFEKQYYEDPAFWADGMLQDENNLKRFHETSALIPAGTKSLLDAGCGNGVFVNYLVEHRPDMEIYGVDRSKAALEFVKANKVVADVSSLPFADNFFDCVCCLEVLEHLPIEVYHTTLKELVRVSKKHLIISVPFNEILENSFNQCPSCKTIFNYELHLRNFDETRFVSMFDGLGVRNVKYLKSGESTHYKFHDKYRKLFYPEQFRKWNSPICPLCGYHEKRIPAVAPVQTAGVPPGKSRKLISYISSIPKLIWPKEKRYYWIIGLFEKV